MKNKLKKTLAVLTLTTIAAGISYLGLGCSKKEEIYNINSPSNETVSVGETASSEPVEIRDEEEDVLDEKQANFELPENVVKELENLEKMLYAAKATEYAYGRADDCFFLGINEWKYVMDDITKNMKESKYYPLIEIMLRSKKLGNNGKVIGNVKDDKMFNTPNKLIGKINETLDGDYCNFEAFEVPIHEDDLYTHDWIEAGTLGYNFRCCEGQLILYLKQCEEENNARFLLSTEKKCIDDLCDAELARNILREGIKDYAIDSPDMAEESMLKYFEYTGGVAEK